MEQNVGMLDRLSRAVVALALIFTLIRSGRVDLTTALMLVLSGALLSTASSGYCALYTHLGISTSDKG
ncbi:MAG TPA: DUF2892 domain-containing protein [Deltaproteobacteria bacterium]|jgi:hypothetical protein|nr:DUF2892 domain-containing protein [Deltaproteobacteria bacterium]HQJ09308.1 DUF2892 domain-containing protein [Deltaproteobacteria bacterium]